MMTTSIPTMVISNSFRLDLRSVKGKAGGSEALFDLVRLVAVSTSLLALTLDALARAL
jgi:hypothetical protein